MDPQQWTRQATKTTTWTTGVRDRIFDLTPDVAPDFFGDLTRTRKRFVVVDENVWEHYGSRIMALLERFRIEHNTPLLIPGGEAAKTRDTADVVMSALDDFGAARFGEDPIGWGGGVLHDVLGVVAGEFRRGIDYRFVGTTVLCAVDAMFALKCGLDEGWKNRVGLYHPAVMSVADPGLFGTLTDSDVSEGLAEIIKWAVCGDAVTFRLLEGHAARVLRQRFQGTDAATQQILTRTIKGMSAELDYELDPARRSYLGHSFSPGLEPAIPHGQAVALDLLLTATIARRRGLIDGRVLNRIFRVVAAAGLPLWHPVLEQRDRLTVALDDTVLHRGGRQLVPVPEHAPGTVTFLDDISPDDVNQGLDELFDRAAKVSTGRTR